MSRTTALVLKTGNLQCDRDAVASSFGFHCPAIRERRKANGASHHFLKHPAPVPGFSDLLEFRRELRPLGETAREACTYTEGSSEHLTPHEKSVISRFETWLSTGLSSRAFAHHHSGQGGGFVPIQLAREAMSARQAISTTEPGAEKGTVMAPARNRARSPRRGFPQVTRSSKLMGKTPPGAPPAMLRREQKAVRQTALLLQL